MLKEALQAGCANVDDNTIGSCAPLLKSRVKDLEATCPMRADEEKVGGLIAKLPGCVTISTGKEPVPDLGCPGDGTAGNGTATANSTVAENNSTMRVKARRGEVPTWE